MKSKFKIHKLSDFITQVSVRNNRKKVSEVYSVTNSEGFIKSIDYFEKEVFSKNISNYKIVSKNQFAYNPSRINVGSVAYLKQDFDVAISPLYIVFKCNKGLTPDYLQRYFKSSFGNNEIRNKTRGAVRDNLTFERLGEIKIPIPSINDQVKLSKLLSKVENLIAQRQNTISLIDDLLRSYYLKSFGDPNGSFTKGKKIPFSKVVKNENSNRVPVKQSDRDRRNGEYPYYGATGIIDTIDEYLFNGEYLLVAEDGKNLMLRRKNNAFIAKGKFWVNNHAHVLSFNGTVNLRYLEFFLNYLDLNPYLTGIDQVKLNKENLDKIPVPVPQMKLQNEFEKLVTQVENIKSAFNSSLNYLRNLYDNLSYRGFVGELNLTRIELDHIIPKSKGGVTNQENLNLVPTEVNIGVGNNKESVLKTIINSHFKNRAFNYQELAEKIHTSLVESENDYNKIKDEVFNALRGKGDVQLNQFFNEKDKTISLQLVK